MAVGDSLSGDPIEGAVRVAGEAASDCPAAGGHLNAGGAGSSTSAGANVAACSDAATASDGCDETASSAATSSEPGDWNSDDEPPQDHPGDEAVCSRDSGVKKRIRTVGFGLERAGQCDIVRLRYRIIETPPQDGPSLAEPGPVEAQVTMGSDSLPLAIEFAVRLMRVGEVAEVVSPMAYSKQASPVYGRSIRNGMRSREKVPRKLRFTPAAPRELHIAARAEMAAAKTSKAAAPAGEAPGDAGKSTASQPTKQKLFHAEVELLHIDAVTVLTEDRTVRKHVLCKGRGLRTPRHGDVVIFSLAEEDSGGGAGPEPLRHKLVLGDAELPHPGLLHVLLSMREGERCLARLGNEPPASAREVAVSEEAAAAAEAEQRVFVTMHQWRRRDRVPVVPPHAAAESACAPLQRMELHPGPSRMMHAIEDGSSVLVALGTSVPVAQPGRDAAAAAAPCMDPWLLLSWRVGEGAVPGYLEAAVAGMRLAESATFEVPRATAAITPPGPSYEGQTPLRRLTLPELRPLLIALLASDGDQAGDACCAAEAVSDSPHVPGLPPAERHEEDACEAATPLVAGGAAGLPGGGVALPDNWASVGQAVSWQALGLEGSAGGAADGAHCFSLTLALIAATEAVHAGEVDEDEQRDYLERERAHGNALARLGRWSEASNAYTKALDAVRRTTLYKSLFPTERGRIEGAYSRDPGEADSPLERSAPEAVESMRSGLIALHLNLALCAAKAEQPREARRHAEIALGANPDNVKALFRRATALVALGDYDAALQDLQRAAELQPQDRAIREELRALRRRMEDDKEAQKNMFQNVFKPAARKPAQSEGAAPGRSPDTEAPPGGGSSAGGQS